MNTTEFRRLNYVIDQFGEITQIDSISETEIFSKVIGEIPIYCVFPISLTEDILLKCEGFTKTEDLGDMVYFDNGKYGVCFDHDEIVFYKCGFKDEIHNLIYDAEHFQFLHQLQNLIKSLTGEELTVNLINNL